MAAMDGRSTPVRALTQMTKVQKATDAGTPAKPEKMSCCGRPGETIRTGSGDRSRRMKKSRSRAFGAGHFRSTGAGTAGDGGFCPLSSIEHWQTLSPEQHEGFPAACTWQGAGKVSAAGQI
jgi:hypothetical protein